MTRMMSLYSEKMPIGRRSVAFWICLVNIAKFIGNSMPPSPNTGLFGRTVPGPAGASVLQDLFIDPDTNPGDSGTGLLAYSSYISSTINFDI